MDYGLESNVGQEVSLNRARRQKHHIQSLPGDVQTIINRIPQRSRRLKHKRSVLESNSVMFHYNDKS